MQTKQLAQGLQEEQHQCETEEIAAAWFRSNKSFDALMIFLNP
ncbi:MAG: hypothetical protein PUE63_07645 [Lachnospiraceae bacterium]|nr:hypothetical protein [Lachnospiraceae bacterium]